CVRAPLGGFADGTRSCVCTLPRGDRARDTQLLGASPCVCRADARAAGCRAARTAAAAPCTERRRCGALDRAISAASDRERSRDRSVRCGAFDGSDLGCADAGGACSGDYRQRPERARAASTLEATASRRKCCTPESRGQPGSPARALIPTAERCACRVRTPSTVCSLRDGACCRRG